MEKSGDNSLHRLSGFNYPSKSGIALFTRRVALFIFPVMEGGDSEPPSAEELRSELISLLEPMKSRLPAEPAELAESFFRCLSEIREILCGDADFIAANDPAATDINEVVMAYPGFFAILVYRLAHCLAALEIPLMPRIMTEYAHSLTGIDIHPKANIGSQFFIDHGTGIVIGETSVIGERVKLYQGVTIGALSVTKGMASTKRHPTIGDDVIIYAGSTILGGNTIIGHDSIIGGNVWLTESVPPFSLVYHKHQMAVRERNSGDINTQKEN